MCTHFNVQVRPAGEPSPLLLSGEEGGMIMQAEAMTPFGINRSWWCACVTKYCRNQSLCHRSATALRLYFVFFMR